MQESQIFLATALTEGVSYEKVFTDPHLWGRWVESAVGCYLLDKADELDCDLFYWREDNEEVDLFCAEQINFWRLKLRVKKGRATAG